MVDTIKNKGPGGLLNRLEKTNSFPLDSLACGKKLISSETGFHGRYYDHTQAVESVRKLGAQARSYSDQGSVLFIGCAVGNKSLLMRIYAKNPPSILFHTHEDHHYSSSNRLKLHEERVDNLKNLKKLLDAFFLSAHESGATGYDIPRNGWQAPRSSQERFYGPFQTYETEDSESTNKDNSAVKQQQSPAAPKHTSQARDNNAQNKASSEAKPRQDQTQQTPAPKPSKPIEDDDGYESDVDDDFQNTQQDIHSKVSGSEQATQTTAPKVSVSEQASQTNENEIQKTSNAKTEPQQSETQQDIYSEVFESDKTNENNAPQNTQQHQSKTDVEKNDGLHSENTKQRKAPEVKFIQTPSEPTDPYEAAMMRDSLNGGGGAG